MNARLIYSLCMYCLTPLFLARLLLRGFRDRRYWHGWRQRLAVGGADAGGRCIWIHAASVGEALAAAPLVDALATGHRLLVSTVTPTGAQIVRERLPAAEHCYVPFDLPGAVRRFLIRRRPRLLLIMETELWPNLIAGCVRSDIPVLLINARLSAKSYAGYRRVRPLVAGMLRQVSLVAAQTDRDAERYRGLGAPDDSIEVMGNLKFDSHPPADAMEAAARLRASWGPSRPVWIAASTHPGEEELVLDADRQLRDGIPDLLTIIVPRHPERGAAVASLISAHGVTCARRSRDELPSGATEVLLVDTLGELWTFYAASDVCFVGGSLVPHGGHNVLEPASLGKPVLTGRHTDNFADICTRLDAAGALDRVRDSDELSARVGTLLRDAAKRDELGTKARRVVAAHQGALERTLERVDRFLVSVSEAGQTAL